MNWFKCDNDGNILLNMNSILEILKNTSIPAIEQNQADILSAIQSISSSGGGSSDISDEQLNQILSAIQTIPSETLVNNQTNMLSKIDSSNSNVDSIKALMTSIYGTLDYGVEGILNAGETSIILVDENIRDNMSIEVFTSKYSVLPNSIDISNGSVILTFDEQDEDMGVKVTFKRQLDWSSLSGGYITKIDGVQQYENLDLISTTFDKQSAYLTQKLSRGSAVIYNNEIHVIGGNTYQSHIKYNGSTWTEVSTLTFQHVDGSAVVYNNEIHTLGGGGGNTNHYKYDGSTWTLVTDGHIPYNFYQGSAVVYNGEIHILGSNYTNNGTKHYKYDGSIWTEVSTLPYEFYIGSAVVLNNEIHILGGLSSLTKHYKWNGSTWTEVSTLPNSFYNFSTVVLNNEIHILGGQSTYTHHYKWNGITWINVNEVGLPYNFYQGSAVVYNNEIHILGSGSSGDESNHYIIDKTVYEKIS